MARFTLFVASLLPLAHALAPAPTKPAARAATLKAAESSDSQPAAAAPEKKRMSASIPFLAAPTDSLTAAGLEDMAGAVDFDPLGLSTTMDIRWLREAEIKHGRVAMLATLGYTLPEVFGLKFPGFQEDWHANPLKAADAMPPSVWYKFIVSIGFVEYLSYYGKPMFEGRQPGEFGFDPLKFSSGKNDEKYALNEIKHGRLAMIAIGGMIHGSFITGTGVFGATT